MPNSRPAHAPPTIAPCLPTLYTPTSATTHSTAVEMNSTQWNRSLSEVSAYGDDEKPSMHSDITTSQMAIQSRVCSAMLSMMVLSRAVTTRLADTMVWDRNSGR